MFNPREGSFGAFELTGRYHQLNVDNDAFILGFADPTRSARQAKAWTLGANWYFNPNLKLNLNYEQTRFTQGSATGDRPTEKLFLSRFQVYF
jgi:phosphate-selective porin OprO/OprP